MPCKILLWRDVFVVPAKKPKMFAGRRCAAEVASPPNQLPGGLISIYLAGEDKSTKMFPPLQNQPFN
jgi:hypothetical protein